ncbi:RHS repeat-associated core domain-containing protein, partial [bacterium]|nr:RHS repeat-associated core domain-containing protein [bacterium]
MTDLKIKKGAEVLYRNQYQYDDVGNRSKLIDEYGAETTYTYDGLYRLTGVQGSYYKRSDGAYNTYSYDTTGNRMQYNSMFNDYEYQYATDSNRLLIERSMNGVEILSYLDFQYDANGNTTHKIHHTGLFETGKEEYLWNCENQMVGYRKYSKNLKSHLFDLTDAMDIEYNLAGMRLSKKVIDVKSGLIKEYDSTLYLYEGSEVELELKIKNDGTVSKKDLYYYGLGKKLYSKEFEEDGSTSAEKVYHQDILGNNILLTDTTGGWVEKTTFGPFGDEIASQRRGRSISAPNGYKFTGKERDRESDLDYFGARYLDYNNGRWMKPDVVNGKYVNPQTLNRFLYSRNNPLKFIDPDGLREVTISIFRHAQNNQVTTGRYTISAVGMNEISGKTIERGAKSISSEGKILPIKAGTYSNIQWYPSSKHGMVINFITKDQKDVPMKNVQLHYGKDETWSDGCIIVGKEFKTNSSTFSQQSSMEAVAEIRRFISEVIG